MMFRAALLVVFSSVVSAKIFNPSQGVAADSEMGQALLRKAKMVKPSRRLEDYEFTFIAGYDIKYIGCKSLIQLKPGGYREEGSPLYTQYLVRFTLCPSDQQCSNSCSGGGEYVIDLLEFVHAYTKAKLSEKEHQCEMIRENCYCDNANDDEMCENMCYQNVGMPECIEYEGQEAFAIQRFLKCSRMATSNDNNQNNNNNNNQYSNYYNQENNNNNNNNNNFYIQNNNNGNRYQNYYGDLFIGPYCASDDYSIHLGVFYDPGCFVKADASLYSEHNYGLELPYSSERIVGTECISCKQVDRDNNNNNNNNGNYNYYRNQEGLCQRTYRSAAKCESNMNIDYKDTSGCDYIHNILPRLSLEESQSDGVQTGDDGTLSGIGVSTIVAWAIAATAILFVAAKELGLFKCARFAPTETKKQPSDTNKQPQEQEQAKQGGSGSTVSSDQK